MLCYSTNAIHGKTYPILEAIQLGLAPDGGLFMPVQIPALKPDWLAGLGQRELPEIAFDISSLYFPELPAATLAAICVDAFNFPAPVVSLNDSISILELFHGPTLAFKDFGARFMARILGHINANQNRPLHILVATSGDTGGAVADGFFRVPGIEVTVLFPKGKISPLQQKQITTFGENVHAVAIEGTFDDCQAIVKKALVDPEMVKSYRMSSANSINLSRLIPQSFYYFEAYRQLESAEPPVFVVPSGNFGNLVAGVLAHRMGLPIAHFVAATNLNDIVPNYLRDGIFVPKPSVETLSNAMDVGNPSNFRRLESLFGSTWNNVRQMISGYAFTDPQTIEAIQRIYNQYQYLLDPHGAVGLLAAESYLEENHPINPLIVLETAHPSKFLSAYEALDIQVHIPERLAIKAHAKDLSVNLPNDYSQFINWFFDAHNS
ncbi:MAG: threonine synthase [Saprospiraceae bacterium]|nr:threonine synthase [Saprospiraceae bacterium]HPG06017.1 threonine synthase [Saprospiraceae bacterium]